MRTSRYFSAVVLVGLLIFPLSGSAQEDANYLYYGGARIPLPADNPNEARQVNPLTTGAPETLTPGVARSQPERDAPSGEAGTEETAESEGYVSSIVSGVEMSHSRDRFRWFYNAGQLYTGVIPNIRDTLPHLTRHQTMGNARRPRNRITWIGFQPFDSFTRVFVQCAASPAYTVQESEEGHLIEIFFDNTSISLTNFQRFLDASYFGRSVDIIDTEPLPGRRSRMIIWRDQIAPYEVIVDGVYLYIDFQDVGHQ